MSQRKKGYISRKVESSPKNKADKTKIWVIVGFSALLVVVALVLYQYVPEGVFGKAVYTTWEVKDACPLAYEGFVTPWQAICLKGTLRKCVAQTAGAPIQTDYYNDYYGARVLCLLREDKSEWTECDADGVLKGSGNIAVIKSPAIAPIKNAKYLCTVDPKTKDGRWTLCYDTVEQFQKSGDEKFQYPGFKCEGGVWSKVEICDDGKDNDDDYDVDCADADCVGKIGKDLAGKTGICEAAETSCTDKFDNDADTYSVPTILGTMKYFDSTDCADSDCQKDPVCAPQKVELCGDTVDNDGDTKIDCNDADCTADPACAPKVRTVSRAGQAQQWKEPEQAA